MRLSVRLSVAAWPPAAAAAAAAAAAVADGEDEGGGWCCFGRSRTWYKIYSKALRSFGMLTSAPLTTAIALVPTEIVNESEFYTEESVTYIVHYWYAWG